MTIRIADIVSGKPVPPRPSPRLRVTPREAQVRAFALFPDLAVTPVRPLGLAAALVGHRHRPPRQLGLAFPGGERTARHEVAAVDAHYGRLGSRRSRRCWPSRRCATSCAASDGCRRATTRIPSSSWGPWHPPGGRSGVDTSSAAVTGEDGVATALVPGAAHGVAAYAADWVGFRGIEVAPEHRRLGLARAIMAALLEWGAERGATTGYLQVLGHNAPALALYEGMGFTTQHAYAYLTPGS